MGEMKVHANEEEQKEQLKCTINSEPYFVFSVRPSRLVDPKQQSKKEDIKLFDFGS